MYLCIDMSEREALLLTIFSATEQFEHKYPGRNSSLLQAVDECMRSHNITLESLSGVAVVTGSGSFTSSRLSALFANILHMVSHTPVLAITKVETQQLSDCISKFTENNNSYISTTYYSEPNLRSVC